MRKRLSYQAQTSTLTLAEGLGEYAQVYRRQLSARGLSVEAVEFFRCHDVVHVVFGCDLGLEQEMVVKIASVLGTTGGRKVWRGYRLQASKEIYATLGAWEIVRSTLIAFWIVPRTVWRCCRMHRPWPWSDFEPYLSEPLWRLRETFGVKV